MRDLGNRALIFLLCATLLFTVKIDSRIVIVCILAIVITCLAVCGCPELFLLVIRVCYCIICLILPVFSTFLPLLAYDSFYADKKAKIVLASITATILLTSQNWPISSWISLIVFSAIAILFRYYNEKYSSMLTQFHRYRDDSTETSISLREKNSALIEKQDYEIHLATLSERNRIAREIHDNVGHLLTRSILQTGALQVINKEETMTQPLSDLHDTLNTAMTSIRSSVHDLHDESINLKYALLDILKTAPELSSLLNYEIQSELPRNVKYAFLSIAKEAVTNTQKHSNADHIKISVREHPALYQLWIEDNGTNCTEIHEGGIGLSNMEERIQALNGNFRISTKDGFHIFISVFKKED